MDGSTEYTESEKFALIARRHYHKFLRRVERNGGIHAALVYALGTQPYVQDPLLHDDAHVITRQPNGNISVHQHWRVIAVITPDDDVTFYWKPEEGNHSAMRCIGYYARLLGWDYASFNGNDFLVGPDDGDVLYLEWGKQVTIRKVG